MALLVILAALLSCSAAQYYSGYYGYAGFPYAYGHHGVYAHGPVDTPEVQAAKAAHFAAHAEAAGRVGAHPAVVAHAAHYAPHHLGYHPLPVQDTPEVAAAKADHFRRYNEAAAAAAAAPDVDVHYDGHHAIVHHAAPVVHPGYAHLGYAHPVYAAGYHPLPVQDTPEVQAAKAAHFAAHAEARARAH